MDAGLFLWIPGVSKKRHIFFKKPCVTLRDTTEWIETADEGWNILAGANKKEIIKGVKALDGHCGSHRQWYGDGNAAESIVEIIKNSLVR